MFIHDMIMVLPVEPGFGQIPGRVIAGFYFEEEVQEQVIPIAG